MHGVEPGSLHPTDHRVVVDRLEAATYLAALGVAGGELTLLEARAAHMDMIVVKLTEMGMTVTDIGGGLWATLVRTAAIGRRGDAPVPRRRHRLQAPRHGDVVRR